MKQKQHNNISESQIEEALVSNLLYLSKILNFTLEVRLVAKQLKLKQGEQRIDILISHGKDLCLIELKVTKFTDEFINQVLEYRNELLDLQSQGKLVEGKIKTYLLVTKATKQNFVSCSQNNIELIIYQPIEVMQNYYENLSVVAPFLKIKPNDYGVFNIGLINKTLQALIKGLSSEKEISNNIHLSKGSVHNHLKLGMEFGLVRKREKKYFLTDIGDKYIENCNEELFLEKLNQKQIDILKTFISKDPFFSSSVFGIYCIVESAFLLSRNIYPITLNDLRKMFKIVSGKINEWQTERSINTATYTFLNFAIDLDLLGKIGKQVVITPAGFRFILMLQLHKSIEMIESLSQDGK